MTLNQAQIAQREAARQHNGEFGTHDHTTAPELTLSNGCRRNPLHIGASAEDGDRVL